MQICKFTHDILTVFTLLLPDCVPYKLSLESNELLVDLTQGLVVGGLLLGTSDDFGAMTDSAFLHTSLMGSAIEILMGTHSLNTLVSHV